MPSISSVFVRMIIQNQRIDIADMEDAFDIIKLLLSSNTVM